MFTNTRQHDCLWPLDKYLEYVNDYEVQFLESVDKSGTTE